MGRRTKITEEEWDENGNLTRRTVTEEEETDPKPVTPYVPPNPVPNGIRVYPTTEPWKYPTTAPWQYPNAVSGWYVTDRNDTVISVGGRFTLNGIEYGVSKKDEEGPDEGLTPSPV